jgi:hypothetical protein
MHIFLQIPIQEGIQMKKTTLAAILVLLVFAMILGISGTALADTYTYTGLGGGLAPLSLASNGSSVFAGMESGHVWRNTGGTSWVDAGNLDGGTVNALVYDGATIYAGTSNGQVYSYVSDGVWNWAGYGAGYGNSVICLVATGVPGSIYAGSSNRHVYAHQSGSNWLDTVTDMGSTVLSLTRSSSYVYASTANGLVYRYNNNPSSPAWTSLGYCGTSAAHVVWNDSYGLYALGYNSHTWMYTGSSWSDLGLVGFHSITTFMSVGSTLYAGNDNGEVWSYGGSWSNTSLPYSGTTPVQALAASGADVFAASWNGHVGMYSDSTWTDLWPTGRGQVNALLSSGGVYAGCENGQVYQYNGSNWVAYGNNLGSPVYSLGAINGRIYASCDDGFVYYYNSGTWASTSGPNTVAHSLAFDGTALFAGCVDGHIWFYEEGGVGWRDGGNLASGWVNTVAWTGTNIYAGTQNGEVFRYDGLGDFHPTGLDTSGAHTTALCWNAPTLYAGTDNGHVYSYNGSAWTDIFPFPSWAVRSLATNGDTVFAGVANGQVLRYMDGTTWNESGSVGTSPVEALAWTGTYMYTGSDVGSYRGTLTVPPAVTTNAATAITSVGATLNGNMSDTGGENADTRGFRYRKTGAGSWTDWTETGTFGTGDFSHPITGLDPATDYDYQACAHNSIGLTYGDTVTFRTSPSPKPVVASVSPSSGSPGTQVTVTGSNYGASQGSSTVTVGGVKADVVSWSNTKIVIIVPEGTQGGAVVVTTAQGGSNTDKDFTVVLSTWYLAEGTNAWGFDTYMTVENPNNEALHAKLTYMDPNPAASGKGIVGSRTVVLPPLSQTTVSSASDIGQVDFSTKVECLEGKTIAVDRTMYWTGSGYSPAQSGYHSSIGTTSPAKTWYLPEGSSAWGFETWTAVLNPNPIQAGVTLTYMTEAGPIAVNKTIPANSRATYNMASDIGTTDASIKVESDQPVVAERSVYRNNRREGSCSNGATSPSSDFFLAEGATGYDVGFITYVLVQNPQNTTNDVTLTYQTQSGKVAGPTFTMQPNSRKTVRVNDQLPPNTSVSTQVHGSKPLIAERAMYWDNGTGQAFHASIGLSDPHMTFMLPDGQTSGGFETWTLIQNPNPGAVTVRVTYLPQGGGKTVTFTSEIPAGTRSTYNMADKLPSGRASILVQSLDGARPIMVERSMYMNNRGAGTDTVGASKD